MARQRLDQLGALQRQVMDVLWSREASTVHDVRDALSTDEKRPAYTTVLSVLQKLEKAGWVTHEREGRQYVYTAARSRNTAGRNAVRMLVDRVFGGDPAAMFQHLLEDEDLSEAELASLRKMIDGAGKERGDA